MPYRISNIECNIKYLKHAHTSEVTISSEILKLHPVWKHARVPRRRNHQREDACPGARIRNFSSIQQGAMRELHHIHGPSLPSLHPTHQISTRPTHTSLPSCPSRLTTSPPSPASPTCSTTLGPLPQAIISAIWWRHES